MVDWEQVLAELQGGGRVPDGFSTQDLADFLGVGLHWARYIVRRAVRQGVLEFAGVRYDVTVDGRRSRRVPMYRLRRKSDGRDGAV